jgi:hypothetical protein
MTKKKTIAAKLEGARTRQARHSNEVRKSGVVTPFESPHDQLEARLERDLRAVIARCPIDNEVDPFDHFAIVCQECRRGRWQAYDLANMLNTKAFVDEKRQSMDGRTFLGFLCDTLAFEEAIASEVAIAMALPPGDMVRRSGIVQYLEREITQQEAILPEPTDNERKKAKKVVLSSAKTLRAGEIARDEFRLSAEDKPAQLAQVLKGDKVNWRRKFHFTGTQQEFADLLIRLRAQDYFDEWPIDEAFMQWAEKWWMCGGAGAWDNIGPGLKKQLYNAKKAQRSRG